MFQVLSKVVCPLISFWVKVGMLEMSKSAIFAGFSANWTWNFEAWCFKMNRVRILAIHNVHVNFDAHWVGIFWVIGSTNKRTEGQKTKRGNTAGVKCRFLANHLHIWSQLCTDTSCHIEWSVITTKWTMSIQLWLHGWVVECMACNPEDGGSNPRPETDIFLSILMIYTKN